MASTLSRKSAKWARKRASSPASNDDEKRGPTEKSADYDENPQLPRSLVYETATALRYLLLTLLRPTALAGTKPVRAVFFFVSRSPTDAHPQIARAIL